MRDRAGHWCLARGEGWRRRSLLLRFATCSEPFRGCSSPGAGGCRVRGVSALARGLWDPQLGVLCRAVSGLGWSRCRNSRKVLDLPKSGGRGETHLSQRGHAASSRLITPSLAGKGTPQLCSSSQENRSCPIPPHARAGARRPSRGKTSRPCAGWESDARPLLIPRICSPRKGFERQVVGTAEHLGGRLAGKSLVNRSRDKSLLEHRAPSSAHPGKADFVLLIGKYPLI